MTMINVDQEIAAPIKYRGLKRFCKNKAAVVSVVYIFVLIFFCLFPALITNYPQNDRSDDLSQRYIPPNSQHWFGTDRNGRDILTEILYGGRVSLRVAIVVAFVSTALGAILGAIAGYRKGWLDSLIMRSTDLFLLIPQIVILAIALNKFGDGNPLYVSFIVAITFWMATARYVRGQVLSLSTREFVDAAKLSGRSALYIVYRHLIPNSWNIIAVSSAFAVANAILIESTLSFLGFGVQPPNTSWGLMLEDAREVSASPNFYAFLVPGMAIFLTVLAFNFIGDGLRDALDPRSEVEQ